MEFEEGDKVYLKFSPIKGVVRFGKKGKLSTRYVGPYEILQRVIKIAYELKIPNELLWFTRFSMLPCLKSVLVIPSLFFLLRVLVLRIDSLMMKFWYNFLYKSQDVKE